MTIVQPSSWNPQYPYFVSPGGGVRDTIVNVGIALAERLITNYVRDVTRASIQKKSGPENSGKRSATTFRHFRGKRRWGKRSFQPGRTRLRSRRSYSNRR